MVRSRRSRRGGYTLVEVMMAIAVMTAGALAMMALHQVTTFGNMQSRQLSTATQCAQTWVERLQRDALMWTVGGPTRATVDPTALAMLLGPTTHLRRVAAPGAAPQWFVPTSALPGENASFDHFGRDVAPGADATYCTNVRLEWVYPAQAIRADVRVWYVRSHASVRVEDLVGCPSGAPLQTLGSQLQALSFVYTSTVIRWTPQ